MRLDEMNISYEETAERLKVTIPLKRNWLYILLFSILILFWVIGLIWGIVFTIRDIAFSGERYAFFFTLMILAWLYIWYRLGKVLWRLWQQFMADREILYIEKDRVIIRRPVSILGITDAYDWEHVSHFLYSTKHNSPGFDYGNQRVYFGENLDKQAAESLVKDLNQRYFDYVDEEY